MNLSKQQQLFIGLILAALMAATRSHHFATVAYLPDISWAVFFLAGAYLASKRAFAGFLALAGAVDYAAITWGGVSDFCVSAAYPFLIPAYGSLWLTGRWFAKRYSFSLHALPLLGASLFTGAVLAELFSSGSFYFLSGRIAEPTLAGFGASFVQYFPHGLATFAFWMGVAAIVHVAFAFAHGAARRHA
ncbi:MAG: hypothetical protein LBE24_02190 [Methylobacillus sp.]|jgi:hypothetical protein|nr:hypothetical protein [Methylobacillus sp.]